MNKLNGTQVLVALMLITLIILLCVIFANIILGGSGPLDFSGWGKDFSRGLNTTTSAITAARLQEEFCSKDHKVWYDESHSCLYRDELETIRGAKMGFQKIPGVAGFRPGDHFWVSSSEFFGNLYEYVIAEDGTIVDYTGIVSSADFLTGKRREIIGPNGIPWFSLQVVHLNGEVWTIWNVVPGHVGWVRK